MYIDVIDTQTGSSLRVDGRAKSGWQIWDLLKTSPICTQIGQNALLAEPRPLIASLELGEKLQ
jgi:hypothetical protein